MAGVGRRMWCCRGRRAAASGFKREVTINMFLGGHVARRGGGGGTASATAAVGNNVPCASRSAAAAFFVRMDVWACGGNDGGYESRCWTARLEGGGGRHALSSLRRTTTMGGIFPRRRRDGDGCGDAAVPSDRQRRRLRRGRGMTRRDERGGGNDKGRERSVDDARRESGE